MKEKAIICAADLHLMLNTPVARLDPDIMETQRLKLEFIQDLSLKLDAPVVFAGDIFDHWKASPELLAFACANMPNDCYSIAGNHDAPHHSLSELHRSGLNVLWMTDIIKEIPHRSETVTNVHGDIRLHGFSYGMDLQDCPEEDVQRGYYNIAVLHRFISPDKQVWQDANEESGLSMLGSVKGYDMILTGDCHIPFVGRTKDGTLVINPGSVLRRTAAQLEHKPRVYVHYPDRTEGDTTECHYLPVKEGVVTREHLVHVQEKNDRLMVLVKKLKTKTQISLDYKQNVMDRIPTVDTIDKECEQLIMSFLEAK